MSVPKHHRLVVGFILCTGIIALTGCVEAVGAAARSSIVSFAGSVLDSALNGALGG